AAGEGRYPGCSSSRRHSPGTISSTTAIARKLTPRLFHFRATPHAVRRGRWPAADWPACCDASAVRTCGGWKRRGGFLPFQWRKAPRRCMIRIMPPRPHHLPEPPPAFPPLPDWTRTAGQCESPEDALFSAGAALAAIHPIACASHPITELWRQRLALASAEAVVRLPGRREDAATLRDHLYFTRPGDDPGPAGSVLLAWQMLAKGSILRPPAPDSDWRETLANLLSFTIDEAAEEAIDAPFAEGARCKNPREAAISVAAL